MRNFTITKNWTPIAEGVEFSDGHCVVRHNGPGAIQPGSTTLYSSWESCQTAYKATGIRVNFKITDYPTAPELGIELRVWRKKFKVSQEAAAQASGVSRNHICSLENGSAQNPTIETVNAIVQMMALNMWGLDEE